jgi:hypothetical protein
MLAAVVTMLADAEAPSVQLPESNEVIFGLVSSAMLLVPVAIVAFIIWQVVLTRRAAERAADAAERAAAAGSTSEGIRRP